MFDLTLRYRECGAECREDWLRMLACDNGLPLDDVQRAADRLGEREDFGRLIAYCEGDGCSNFGRPPQATRTIRSKAV